MGTQIGNQCPETIGMTHDELVAAAKAAGAEVAEMVSSRPNVVPGQGGVSLPRVVHEPFEQQRRRSFVLWLSHCLRCSSLARQKLHGVAQAHWSATQQLLPA